MWNQAQSLICMYITVKPDASQDEVDEIIDADDTPQIFVQSVSHYLYKYNSFS